MSESDSAIPELNLLGDFIGSFDLHITHHFEVIPRTADASGP